MAKLIKRFAWIALAIIVMAILFSGAAALNQSQELPLNELANKIEEGAVKNMTVTNDGIIKAELTDGTKIKSSKEPGAGLTDSLKNYGVTPEQLKGVPMTVTDSTLEMILLAYVLPTLLPILVIIIIIGFMMRKQGGGAQALSFGKSNLKLFTSFKEKITFKDVAGLNEAKQELEEVVDFLKNPEKYEELGAKIPRGVLLMGNPGCGKTLMARAVAGEAGVPFFHISASEFVEMFVGVGASRTRDAFKTAKSAAPSILFIDEIDAIGRERGTGMGGGHDEREQTLNQILVEMDGFERGENVIVLAATNRPDVLDPALLRPGRFDRRVVLDLPDIKEREEILKIHAKGKPLSEDVELKKIAVRTPGFSGADLANIVNEAAIAAARDGKKKIDQESLYDAIEKVILGPARKSKVISDKEKKIVAYHEAGHALVAAALPDADPVHKVSAISRGRAGGYTMQLPIEEIRLKTKKQLLAELSSLVGGYAAEETVFNDISTGASSDLQRVSEIARAVVTKFGMSDKLGPLTYGETQEMVYMGREITERNYSDETASLIDSEIKKLAENAHTKAKEILSEYKDALKAIAEALIEKETLEQDDFYALIEPFGLKKQEN